MRCELIPKLKRCQTLTHTFKAIYGFIFIQIRNASTALSTVYTDILAALKNAVLPNQLQSLGSEWNGFHTVVSHLRCLFLYCRLVDPLGISDRSSCTVQCPQLGKISSRGTYSHHYSHADISQTCYPCVYIKTRLECLHSAASSSIMKTSQTLAVFNDFTCEHGV